MAAGINRATSLTVAISLGWSGGVWLGQDGLVWVLSSRVLVELGCRSSKLGQVKSVELKSG